MRRVTCALGAAMLILPGPGNSASAPHLAREVDFAQRVILGNLVMELSPSARTARDHCGGLCPESGTVEMGISLLGVGGSATTLGLLNMLALRLDGAASEEMHSQFLSRGRSIVPQLMHMSVSQAFGWCRATFKAVRGNELSGITDVPAQNVCRSASEIDHERRELVAQLSPGHRSE